MASHSVEIGRVIFAGVGGGRQLIFPGVSGGYSNMSVVEDKMSMVKDKMWMVKDNILMVSHITFNEKSNLYILNVFTKK